VRDHEIRVNVGDQLIHPADELVHRDVLDARRLLVVDEAQLRADRLRADLGLAAPALVVVRDRHDRHGDGGALLDESGEQATRADLEVIRVCTECEHSPAVFE